MEDKIIDLLQERMNKCMNDQFWAVAAVSAQNAFLITQKEVLLSALPVAAYVVALLAATSYALYYVWHRHKEYYKAKNDIAARLKKKKAPPPKFMDRKSHPWEWRSLVGLTFCSFWILGSSVAAFSVLIARLA